jgi:hypothetical protein
MRHGSHFRRPVSDRTARWTALLPSTWRRPVPWQRLHRPYRLAVEPRFFPVPSHRPHGPYGWK